MSPTQSHRPALTTRAPSAPEPRALEPDQDNSARIEALRGQDGNFSQHGFRPPDAGGFGGRVALTFDDGPDIEKTPRILEILEKHGILATFFVHGAELDHEGALEVAQQIRDKGHLIGNHTESHVLLGGAPRAQPHLAGSQIDRTRERLADLTVDQPSQFLRFPGGDANAGSIRAAESRGYAVAGWHVDSADWCFDETIRRRAGPAGTCAESVFRYMVGDRTDFAGSIVESTKKFDGGILLFHDTRSFTVDHLESVIEALVSSGFTFTNLDDAETFPILNAQAAALQQQP
jgi:peptidoglycan/xylan/chitin deacetylase (PgdA/CDA1 family)